MRQNEFNIIGLQSFNLSNNIYIYKYNIYKDEWQLIMNNVMWKYYHLIILNQINYRMLFFEFNEQSSLNILPWIKLKKMDIENQASKIITCPRNYFAFPNCCYVNDNIHFVDDYTFRIEHYVWNVYYK